MPQDPGFFSDLPPLSTELMSSNKSLIKRTINAHAPLELQTQNLLVMAFDSYTRVHITQRNLATVRHQYSRKRLAAFGSEIHV